MSTQRWSSRASMTQGGTGSLFRMRAWRTRAVQSAWAPSARVKPTPFDGSRPPSMVLGEQRTRARPKVSKRKPLERLIGKFTKLIWFDHVVRAFFTNTSA